MSRHHNQVAATVIALLAERSPKCLSLYEARRQTFRRARRWRWWQGRREAAMAAFAKSWRRK